MKKTFYIIIFLGSILLSASAQRVGLVLSGGGARGITHIGIIKALEENGIPIDYITGTSMGAIVGGFYAMGYTPDEIIAVLKSEDFKYWSTGELEPEHVYYYRTADPKPKLAELNLRVNRLDSIDIKSFLLPTNLVSPRQMNYAFLPLFAQANAVSGGDFDKLFVPFRCVASDIYKKEAVIFRRGELGDAVRASMTFPFMFKPITINNRLLFDGGIFNNFPVDVMREDFKPDFIIGSAVSSNPKKPDEHDIVMQIENMIMSKTDYSIKKEEGILLNFDIYNYNTFDFSKVDELVKLGYDSTIQNIDKIKAAVARRVSVAELAGKRSAFRSRFPELTFQNIKVEGVDSLQKQYVENAFHSRNRTFTLSDFKEAYFRLISDEMISEVMPHAQYNEATGHFDLNLKVKTESNLKVQLGANVSSSTSNQAYFGLSYRKLSEFAQTSYIDAQFGRMYNGLGFGTRIDVPAQKNWYLKIAAVFHRFDYYQGNQFFYIDSRLPYFNHYEGYSKLTLGIPSGTNGLYTFGIGFCALTDNYIQNGDSISSSMKKDNSEFALGSAFGRFEKYTLNDLMYPTKGYYHSVGIQMTGGEQSFESAYHPLTSEKEMLDLWVQLKAKTEKYYPLTSRFTMGAYGELALTTRKLLQNYSVTVIEAPAFRPTPHSRTVFNEAFCANQYAAIGIKPIYTLTQQLHLRGEAYWFVPYKTILHNADNSARYSKAFYSTQFMAESSLVFNFKIASASLYVNYYNASVSKWNFGINVGFLLFNPKFTD